MFKKAKEAHNEKEGKKYYEKNHIIYSRFSTYCINDTGTG